MGLFDLLEKETKRIEEEKSKNVATITEAEFLKVSADAVTETKITRELVKDNPFLLLALADYSCNIGEALFHKEDKKESEGEPDKNRDKENE